jgi:poly(A) polymerase
LSTPVDAPRATSPRTTRPARSLHVEPSALALDALRQATEVAHGVEHPEGMQEVAPEHWHTLSVSQMRTHLDRLIVGRHPDTALDALLTSGCLDVWMPEVRAMVGFGDGEWRHKDVWKHTKQVVWQSVPRLEVRWGCLLHDIGKVKTRSVGPRGEIHFYGHSEVGAAMFRRRFAKRLGFEGALHDRVHFLILNHLRASQYDGTWTDSAVRRFAREMGPGLKDLLDLSRADITTKRPEKKKRGLRQISELSRRVKAVQAQDERVPPLPKGLGSAIIERFQIPPSKRVGNLRAELEALCETGALESGRDVDFYIDWMRAHAARFAL